MKLRDLSNQNGKFASIAEDMVQDIGMCSSVLYALLEIQRIANIALTDMTDTREYEVQYLTALEAIMDVEIDL